MSCGICLRVDGDIVYDASTNIATIPLSGAIPDTGRFEVCFPNCGGSSTDPYCVTPCTYPQAIVNFSYGDTTYANILCPKGCAPGYVRLSQLVKGARDWGKLHFCSAYGTDSKAIFSVDCLPAPNCGITLASTSSSSSNSSSATSTPAKSTNTGTSTN